MSGDSVPPSPLGGEEQGARPGWNPPGPAGAVQHYFDFGEQESLCGSARDSGARAPYPDERHPICARCLRIVRAIAPGAGGKP